MPGSATTDTGTIEFYDGANWSTTEALTVAGLRWLVGDVPPDGIRHCVSFKVSVNMTISDTIFGRSVVYSPRGWVVLSGDISGLEIITYTGTATPTVTPTPVSTLTATPTPTATLEPTPVLTATPIPTATITPTPTTTTPTPILTATLRPTLTITSTPVPTANPTTTPAITVTPSPTTTPEITVTPGITVTPVLTVTPRVTVTPVLTVTPEITVTPVLTVTPAITVTPVLTVTPTPSATIQATPTITATPEITVTPEITTSPPPTGIEPGFSGRYPIIALSAVTVSIVNSATLNSDQTPPVTDIVNTPVIRVVDPAITKGANPQQALPGEPVSFSILAENLASSNANATNMVVVDVIPYQLDLLDYTVSSPPGITPIAIAGQPTPTPVMPVLFLPATGVKETLAAKESVGGWLLVLALLGVVVLWQKLGKRNKRLKK